jgi:hypothetical protein
VALILALGTAAFVVSVMVPRIDPVEVWAHDTNVNKQEQSSNLRTIFPPKTEVWETRLVYNICHPAR